MSPENFSTYSDADLWKLVRASNFHAFDEIYARYWSKMYYSSYKVIKNHVASEDIVQEVFTDLWMKRKDTVITSLSAYLYGMVRNQVFNFLRNNKISKEHLERINHISFVEQTEQMVNFNQLKESYHKSVEALPERCREVFNLSRNENLSIKEIAQRLDISPKTVENQMTKALKYLRMALKETVLLAVFFLS